MTHYEKTIAEQQRAIRHYERALQESREAAIQAHELLEAEDQIAARSLLERHLSTIGIKPRKRS